MKSFGRHLLFGLFAVSAFLGCNKEPIEQVMLEIDRTNMKMTVGQSQKLNAELKGAEGEVVWESDSPEIAAVDASGVVTAVAAGKANIIASSMGQKNICAVEVVNFRAAKLELNDKFQTDGIGRYTYTIAKGNTVDLDPKFYNADGEKVNEMAYPKFEFVEAEQTVASVDENGVVEALSAGVATLRISGAELEAFVTFTVKSVELSKSEMTLWVNQQDILTVAVLPQNLTVSEKEVTWTSADEEYVSVSSTGVVTALKSTDGIEPVSVMATCGDIIAECKVTVSDYKIDEIKVSNLDALKTDDGSYELLVGDNPYTLDVKLFKGGEDVGETVRSLNITTDYSSSYENVVTIKGGVMTPVGPGTTEITIGCAGASYSFWLNVIQCVENVVITSPQNPYNASAGDEFTIEYKILPENASVKTARFESSDIEVADVDNNGKVTVKKDGQTVIKVISVGMKKPYTNSEGETAQDPAVANLMVIVGNTDTDKPSSLSITGEGVENGSLVIKKGAKVQLSPVVEPAGYTGGFIWSTTTDGVASITDAGLLSADSRGETEVVLLAGGATAKLPVRVVGIDPTAIKIDQELENVSTSDMQLQLTASVVSPENADLAGVNWYSSDEELATVDSNGLVQLHQKGTVTITAKAVSDLDGKELSSIVASVTFEITAPPVSQIILPKGVMVEVGESRKLEFQVLPTGADINEVAWTIEDGKDLASIDGSGVITGISCERVEDPTTKVSSWRTVTVKVNVDEVSATGQVAIIPRQPSGIELDVPQNNQLKVEQSWDFNPRVLPSDLSGFTVGVYSTPYGSMTNANAPFIPETPGSYQLTFYTESNDNLVYQRQRSVSISVDPYWVESVIIPESLELEVGGSVVLSPEFTSDVEGHQPTYKEVKWTSSDPEVASIDEKTGEIVARKSGQVNITVQTTNPQSVPSGQMQKSATCILTVKAAETSLNVGDYFYSDGTWSAELQSAKTVVGVVFAKANVAASDPILAKDFPGCTHGLVLGLNEYSQQDFGAVSTYSGHGNYTGIGYDASSIVNVDKPNGYGNSKAHRELNAAKPDYVSMFNEQSGVIAEQTNAVATPSGASSWYVPSFKEMGLICAGSDVLNASLKAVGGTEIAAPYDKEDSWDDNRSSDWYWTSTIYGVLYNSSYDHYKYAFDISRGSWTSTQQSSAKCKVRVVFAF